MKLSRTAWLVLGIGFFIIAFVTLYVIYSGQSGEQRRLSNSLAEAQARLPKFVSQREDLENQLAQRQNELSSAESSLSRAKSRLSLRVESIEYDEILFGIARDCDLVVAELTASEPTEEKLKGEAGDVIYAKTTFSVEVEAAVPKPASVAAFEGYIDDTILNILAFIDAVATSNDFTNATIELVNMKNLKPPLTEEEREGAKKPSAIIRIVIYKYKGE